MNASDILGRLGSTARQALFGGTVALLATAPASPLRAAEAAQRPSTEGHVAEMAEYLDRVQIAEPVTYRHLAVYSVLLRGDVDLRGKWLTLDAAISRGVLVVTEKGRGGSVPAVVVENRSRTKHVFLMAGELLSGGKQTRTVRRDVVLAPGQRVELEVFCVEARRWEGGDQFSASGSLVPQSIQKELRRGAGQQKVWSEIARNNMALEAENATGSLELALKAGPVREKLGDVRRSIVPRIPEGTLGYLFVNRGRAIGADFFGRAELARAMLPKLLDSYAVDCVVLDKTRLVPPRRDGNRGAIDFFRRICRAGSRRTGTPGSGAGIRTRAGGLMGDGVSLGGVVVHYGVQIQDPVVPRPVPLLESPPRQSPNVR